MRNDTYVIVGKTVVGAFYTVRGVVRCINAISPGANPQIKKGRLAGGIAKRPKHRSNEVQRVRYLKPGEFKL